MVEKNGMYVYIYGGGGGSEGRVWREGEIGGGRK